MSLKRHMNHPDNNIAEASHSSAGCRFAADVARPLPLVMLDLTLNVLVLQCVEATQPVLKRLRLSYSEPDVVSPHLAAVWVPSGTLCCSG